jgi:uncharacterized protein YbjT (DUF2867 family)
MTEHNTVLVTGATGRVGGQVVRQLAGTGGTVRALVRDPEAAVLPPGVERAQGDLSDASSLTTALNGVDTVFLVFPTMYADDAAPSVISTIARHAGRIVYLSTAGADEHTDGILGSHGRMERLIEQSGMDWTFVRPRGFAANTLMWSDQIRAGDVVRWIYGAATRSLIHEYDIASVAVRTLTEDGHSGARHHLTGPGRLTQIEQVTAIGEAIGRPLRFEEVPPEVARQEFFAGLPGPFVDSILAGQAAMVDNPEPVTPTVEDLTGTPARTFRRWAIDHAADFQAVPSQAVLGQPGVG